MSSKKSGSGSKGKSTGKNNLPSGADSGTVAETQDNAATQEQNMTEQTQGEAAAETASTDSTPKTMTFTKKTAHKTGLVSYVLAGVRGSIYIGKGLFGGNPPTTIEVNAVGLAQPDPVAAAKAAEKAAKSAKNQKSLSERLAAQETRAKKAQERLAKLQEAAKKAGLSQDATTAAVEAADAVETEKVEVEV